LEDGVSERTLAILKPDCVQKKLAGKVLNHLLSEGFRIVSMKMVKLTPATAGEFYAVHKDRPFFKNLVNFMTECEIIPLVLEKEEAISDLRRVIGATDPSEAAAGTIRKLYAENKQNNIIHASDGPETAKNEIAFFFSIKELLENKIL
jgi:nucleoside-diphosphate kinase